MVLVSTGKRDEIVLQHFAAQPPGFSQTGYHAKCCSTTARLEQVRIHWYCVSTRFIDSLPGSALDALTLVGRLDYNTNFSQVLFSFSCAYYVVLVSRFSCFRDLLSLVLNFTHAHYLIWQLSNFAYN